MTGKVASKRASLAAFIHLLWILLNQNGVLCQVKIPYTPDEMSCPGPDVVFMTRNVMWGIPGRAYLTLPDGLIIAPSKIPGAGFGVISTTFIRKHIWLGEAEGEIVSNEQSAGIGEYAWMLTRNDDITAHADAYYLDRSSYHRFVNSPTRYADENVIFRQCYGKIFYMTKKDIAPGDELYLHYGAGYTMQRLGFDLNEYYDVAKIWKRKGLDLNSNYHRQLLVRHNLDLHDVCSTCPIYGFIKAEHLNRKCPREE